MLLKRVLLGGAPGEEESQANGDVFTENIGLRVFKKLQAPQYASRIVAMEYRRLVL